MDEQRYYERLAAAYVRGYAGRTGRPVLLDRWLEEALDDLDGEDIRAIIAAGKEMELKMYRFKDSHSDLPRVKKVMGFLKGISFESLLDVGSGRGVFLFPFLTAFPWVKVTAADILPHRIEFLQDIARGGIDNLAARRADICDQPLPDNSVDVVTLLEVLEHIPAVDQAVGAAVKMARKFVVVSVPSKEDNNPEHIHLLTKERLTELFCEAGYAKLHFDGVNGHLILVASMAEKQTSGM